MDRNLSRAIELLERFCDLVEWDVLGALPNGNKAFGIDEGEVTGNEILGKLLAKTKEFLEEVKDVSGSGSA